MHAISNQKDVNYLEILQPTFGLDLSKIETENLIKKELKDANYYRKRTFLKNNKNYYSKINALYTELRDNCDEIEFCFDMSKFYTLNNNTKILNDPRHHNSLGNNLIADKIVNEITKLDLIPNKK